MAARTLWFSSDGSVMVDLDEVIATDWREDRDSDDDKPANELFVWFRVESDHCLALPESTGNELMAALRRHAQWPEGSPYRG